VRSVPSPLAVKEPWDLVATAYAQEITPEFEHFARRALELAAAPRDSRIADVAAGPGTLTLLAARAGHRVSAIDFSPNMVLALRARLAAEPSLAVEASVGDGMALPFEDGAFAAAFSMFGLMFFPDRARGFSELYRVLELGGRAVISSWLPLDRIPVLAATFSALNELRPPPPGTPPFKPPLADPESCREEMTAAGFRDVVVHEVTHVPAPAPVTEVWESFQRSSAPIAMLRVELGADWDALARQIEARLVARFGEAPQELVMPAYLTVGVR
jgi:SAM-dependent methyltransferase